jgi:hypothetical protein
VEIDGELVRVEPLPPPTGEEAARISERVQRILETAESGAGAENTGQNPHPTQPRPS